MAARKGGKGRSDLYLSRQQEGKWTTPQNLGDTINSAGSEYSPQPFAKWTIFLLVEHPRDDRARATTPLGD